MFMQISVIESQMMGRITRYSAESRIFRGSRGAHPKFSGKADDEIK